MLYLVVCLCLSKGERIQIMKIIFRMLQKSAKCKAQICALSLFIIMLKLIPMMNRTEFIQPQRNPEYNQRDFSAAIFFIFHEIKPFWALLFPFAHEY